MASNNKWQKINGAENTISAVSQSHTRFAVGYIGLDGTPEYDAETRCWDFRVLMDVGDLGRITVFAQDKNSGPDTSRLVIDETTYSYGPVDYLTISSCGNPVFEKVAE